MVEDIKEETRKWAWDKHKNFSWLYTKLNKINDQKTFVFYSKNINILNGSMSKASRINMAILFKPCPNTSENTHPTKTPQRNMANRNAVEWAFFCLLDILISLFLLYAAVIVLIGDASKLLTFQLKLRVILSQKTSITWETNYWKLFVDFSGKSWKLKLQRMSWKRV